MAYLDVANKEIVSLIEWLKTYNSNIDEQSQQKQHKQQQQEEGNGAVKKRSKIGFYGLDLYSLWESTEAVIEYLKKVDPDAVRAAYDAYNCFEPYGKSVENYARALLSYLNHVKMKAHYVIIFRLR